jgi:signal transduction histidine kinase
MMGRMHAKRIAPWAAAFVTTAGLCFASVLDTLAGKHGGPLWSDAAFLTATIASAAVGFVLATRRPGNPIGWLLMLQGLVLAGLGVTGSYAAYAVLEDPGALPGGEWAVLFDERCWPALFASVTFIAFVFPDGRLPSPRWRPVLTATIVSFAGLIVLSLFTTDDYSEQFRNIKSPLPDLTPVISIPFLICGLGAFAGMIAACFAVRGHFKRAGAVERMQLKWLAYSAALVPAAVVACVIESSVAGGADVVTGVAVSVALVAIPVAIGIAVLRHRLYEIDRLINRTLVYAVLTAALAATFAAVSLLLGVAIGSGSTLPTAAATLAVALLFAPLRRRAQLLVDRRFDRARYEGLRRVERHLEDLRAGRAAPETTGEVLSEAVGDPNLELFYWLPGEAAHVDPAGVVLEGLADTTRSRTPVRRGEFPLATVLHDRRLDERPDLLDSVIESAGLAIEIARLRIEVSRQLAEVDASRARIVTAGYEERRRLERDIHDGAQQRLVSIGLALRHVQSSLPGDGDQARALDATVAEVARAIEELRELARGVRPAGLDDGLGAALRQLAARSRLPTTVESTGERFEDRVEAAAYFVASEAVANAAKHAAASSVTISASRHNGSLVMSVRDNGCGGAAASEGTGLAGLADRVAALGGSLHIDSPAGAGTSVTAELPCG